MSDSRPLRIGMIGGGSWADRHLRSYQKGGAEVVVIYNRTRERADKLAEEFGIPDVSLEAESIIERDDIDAVSISMPHNMHFDLSLKAIEAGKHVYCEKPLAMDYPQAREMWHKSVAAEAVQPAPRSGHAQGSPTHD